MIQDHIRAALKEDMPWEDISTNAIYQSHQKGSVSVIMKEDGLLAGVDVFKQVFNLLDDQIVFVDFAGDGDWCHKGDIILEVRGDVRTLLSGERVAMNYLQHMSGIASYTKACIEALDDPKIKLLDTRKTLPTLRIFEKYAVRIGGGYNHRYSLSDGIMLKDNHIDAAGSIANAVKRVRDYAPFVKKIEVEVESLEGVQEALDAGVDIIMLDNMGIDQVKKAVAIIGEKAIIECSGNIDKDNISRYKGLGIDYVSSGALTHSARPLDISMKNLRYLDEPNRNETQENY